MTDMMKRNAEIVRLRVSGLSLDEIGRMHGLTRERVRQILIKLGGPSVVCVRQAQRVARQDQLTHDRGTIARDSTPGSASPLGADGPPMTFSASFAPPRYYTASKMDPVR